MALIKCQKNARLVIKMFLYLTTKFKCSSRFKCSMVHFFADMIYHNMNYFVEVMAYIINNIYSSYALYTAEQHPSNNNKIYTSVWSKYATSYSAKMVSMAYSHI